MKRYYPIIILCVIAIVAIIIRVSNKSATVVSSESTNIADNPTVSTTPNSPTKGNQVSTTPASVGKMIYEPTSAKDMIRVDSPLVNATLYASSPIKVSGQALGRWFFEASFPVLLTDASGKVISTGRATAGSTWMTDSYVSFLGYITYVKQVSGSHGYVILKKDNPSDLSQNDASVKIPVTFK